MSLRRILIVTFIAFVVLVFGPLLVRNTHVRNAVDAISSTRILPSLFQNGGTRSQLPTLDIVVAMYQENVTALGEQLESIRSLSAFKDLDIRTIIYTKDQEASTAAIRADTNATIVRKLPNLGREGGTYLSHVLLNWDDLARHTLFIQAAVHQPEQMIDRLQHNFNKLTGVLPLNRMESCHCRDCHDPWEEANRFPRLAQLYSAINGELCPEEITLTYSGQMLVSAARIRRRNRDIYAHLQAVLQSDGAHWIHGDGRADWRFADDQDNPFFGHTLERAYLVLWDCANTSILERCGRWEHFVADAAPLDPAVPGWCQCLDGVEPQRRGVVRVALER